MRQPRVGTKQRWNKEEGAKSHSPEHKPRTEQHSLSFSHLTNFSFKLQDIKEAKETHRQFL